MVCLGSVFKIAITTDESPTETFWDLVNLCNGIVEAEGGGYSSDSTLHEHEHCVPAAKYKFTIQDSAGDGLCCGYGQGKYEVFVDGVRVIEGGEFQTIRLHEVRCCPVEGPTSLPPYAYDCLCVDAIMGYISKSYTNCTSYIQCSRGRMVQ